MDTLTIRHLEDDLMARLRVRAATHGRSPEDEARCILQAALGVAGEASIPNRLARAIRARAQRIGGIDLELPSRDAAREPPD